MLSRATNAALPLLNLLRFHGVNVAGHVKGVRASASAGRAVMDRIAATYSFGGGPSKRVTIVGVMSDGVVFIDELGRMGKDHPVYFLVDDQQPKDPLVDAVERLGRVLEEHQAVMLELKQEMLNVQNYGIRVNQRG